MNTQEIILTIIVIVACYGLLLYFLLSSRVDRWFAQRRLIREYRRKMAHIRSTQQMADWRIQQVAQQAREQIIREMIEARRK